MHQKKYDLEQLADVAMRARGLRPDIPQEVYQQLSAISQPAQPNEITKDLRALLWCSIDNDDSRDLDQLTYAERDPSGGMTIWVAIADVDALVAKGSAIDRHAQFNTTSVYTPAKVFPMLPEKLSTDLTSLNENEDRLAIVTKVRVNDLGGIDEGTIFSAIVRNRAQLTYNSVGSWLEGEIPVPTKIAQVSGLEEALHLQHEVAQILMQKRHDLGALTLESPEVEAKIRQQEEVILRTPSHNFADQLIEHFMITANTVIARKLKEAKIPSLRRIVRTPKRWDRIIAVAGSLGFKLPSLPNSKALESFLLQRKAQDPTAFPDLSLTVIKLLGRGEYIVEEPGDQPVGHFALALSEYAHSTAPNRRFPDLIAQRQCKALLQKNNSPYSLEELKALAVHCTTQEDAAMKVERHLSKSAAAMLLSSSIGATYQGIITGANKSGTWARIFDPPVEGRVIQGFKNLDVGDRITVQLVSVDVPKGFINFTAKVH